MPDFDYLLSPSVFSPGGIANPPDIPDGSLLDINGAVVGVTDSTFTGDHSCLACVDDHVGESEALLLPQFQDCPRIKALLGAFAIEIQQIEDTCCDLLTCFHLSTAAAAQLDEVGRLLNFTRGEMVDADYRLVLYAKVIANRSSGRGDEFINAFRMMVPGLSTTFTLTEGPASAELTAEMGGTMFTATFTNLTIYQILNRIRGAAIAFWYKFFVQPDNTTIFQCAPTLGTSVLSATKGLANAGQTTGGHLLGVYGPNHI